MRSRRFADSKGMAERRDIRDIVDIEGLRSPGASFVAGSDGNGPNRPWLGVFFRCCGVYGRMYRLRGEDRYAGRCPRCLAPVGARVGAGGTSQRLFFADS